MQILLGNVINSDKGQKTRGVNIKWTLLMVLTQYKHKPGIHNKLKELLKPVFMSLSNDELLAKCLHDKTQHFFGPIFLFTYFNWF